MYKHRVSSRIRVGADVSYWQQKGSCRGHDPEIFFIEDDDTPDVVDQKQATALEICFKCPVRTSCLEWAQTKPERYGTWGGTTESQRRAINFRRHRVRCPSCRSAWVEELVGRSEVCYGCGLTWKV